MVGLVLIPIGIWRHRRRIAAGQASDEWPVIDLRLPRTRTVIFVVGVLTLCQRADRLAGRLRRGPSHGVGEFCGSHLPHDDGA